MAAAASSPNTADSSLATAVRKDLGVMSSESPADAKAFRKVVKMLRGIKRRAKAYVNDSQV